MKSDNGKTSGPIFMMMNGTCIPVPEVLTEYEVIKMLRLDVDGSADPEQTLAYYRDKGLLQATRIGRRMRY